MSRLFNGEVKEEVKKTDYMLMLEEEYKDIEFNKSDDFDTIDDDAEVRSTSEI